MSKAYRRPPLASMYKYLYIRRRKKERVSLCGVRRHYLGGLEGIVGAINLDIRRFNLVGVLIEDDA